MPDYAHYRCQCGRLFSVEEIDQARFDYPCPNCHAPISEAHYKGVKNTEQQDQPISNEIRVHKTKHGFTGAGYSVSFGTARAYTDPHF